MPKGTLQALSPEPATLDRPPKSAGLLDRLRRAAGGTVLEPDPDYRTFIGVLGATLPFILIGAWWLLESKVETSISAYYYTQMRDWFVGTLCVIGIFLFFYKYSPRQPEPPRPMPEPVRTGKADAWLGKAAGVCAVIVALVPTAPPPETKDVPPTIGALHGLAAAALFVCLALFPLLLFSQSRRRSRTYKAYGWTMIGLLALTVLYVFAPHSLRESLAPLRPLLALETALIVVFGASWFAKGRELAASGD